MIRVHFGGYGQALGEGDLTTLPTRIHSEESSKIFYTNIFSYFAGTFEGAWLYALAKTIRVVLVYLILIPCWCNYYIGQPKYTHNKVWRRLHINLTNWSYLELQCGGDGEYYTIRCNSLCICYFLQIIQVNTGRFHDSTRSSDTRNNTLLPIMDKLNHGSLHHFVGKFSIIWRKFQVHQASITHEEASFNRFAMRMIRYKYKILWQSCNNINNALTWTVMMEIVASIQLKNWPCQAWISVLCTSCTCHMFKNANAYAQIRCEEVQLQKIRQQLISRRASSRIMLHSSFCTIKVEESRRDSSTLIIGLMYFHISLIYTL